MSQSTFGKKFTVTTWGESHGKALGAVVDGVPAGLFLTEEDIQAYLDRRKPGQSRYTTARSEGDKVEILSGVFEGKTTGMSWGRVENPKKVFTVGETVKVMIKDIKGEKIALTMKFPEENPWLTAAEDFAVGNVVTGKVARMTDFGAFVELAPGVDALLHVSQISREHVAKPSDVLTIGQEIQAKVVDFNGEDKKISLSMKALEAPAEEASVEE